jgi:hypothetical protein
MIRLTWRQFRTQAAVGIGALVAVAIVAAITGLHLVNLYDTNVATCAAHGDCSAATTALLRNDTSLRTWLDVLVVVVPGIMGIFWGAPLVAREIEAGTFRLAWTQSVTRTRWLAVKLGVIGLAGMAVAGLLSLIVTSWCSPLDRVNMNQFGSFDQRDIVPIGYAAFAFALGVTAGILIRRTLPAMATTLVAFVTARLALIHWIRSRLIAPVLRDYALNPVTTGFGSSGSLLSGRARAPCNRVPRASRTPGSTQPKSSTSPVIFSPPSSSRAPAPSSVTAGPHPRGRPLALRCPPVFSRRFRTV